MSIPKKLNDESLYLVIVRNLATMIISSKYWNRDNMNINGIEQKIGESTTAKDIIFPDYKTYIKQGVLIITKKNKDTDPDIIYIRPAPPTTGTIDFVNNIFSPVSSKLLNIRKARRFYLVTYNDELNNKTAQLEGNIKKYLGNLNKPLAIKEIRYLDKRIFYVISPEYCGAPKHSIVSMKDRKIMGSVFLLPKNIQSIKLRDPQLLWLDADVGDMIEITGYSYESGIYGNVRAVVA